MRSCVLVNVALTTLVSAVLTPCRAWAGIETVLYAFSGPDGEAPLATLVRDNSGNLYGTTYSGGAAGAGCVFELKPTNGEWKETVLYAFTGGNDGGSPAAGLIFDKQGNLYGTTERGGVYDQGTVFVLKPASSGWTETVLWSFAGGNDGAGPRTSLLLDSAGNLYGTTVGRGNGCFEGCGTAFELKLTRKGWKEEVLYSFTNGTEGGEPWAGMVMDTSGSLYGTTLYGGLYTYGVVFKLRRAKRQWRETILCDFTGNADGGAPYSGVAFDNHGNLYGTTNLGGYKSGDVGYGTVFELGPSKRGRWKLTVAHTFTSSGDGRNPYAGVTLDENGNLYGTTFYYGLVYKLARSGGTWKESVLYTFTGGSDGGNPYAGVILDGRGNIYGTTSEGGNSGCSNTCGVVFEVKP